MQLLIHGGLHKTGSTFIQNTFFENRQTLLQAGILYPVTGLSNDPEVGYRHAELLKSLQMEGSSSVAWGYLEKEIERSNVERCIISRENFATLVPPALIEELAPVADVHLIICIRHPVDYLESKYREWVHRIAYSGSPSQFYAMTAPQMNWEDMVAPWASMLGEDRVHIISVDHLEDRASLPNAVLRSGFKDLGDLRLKPTKRYNPTISNGECLLLLTANRLRLAGIPLPKSRQLIAFPTPYHGDDGRLFSDAIIADVRARFENGYQRLLARAAVAGAANSGKWTSRPFDAGFMAPENSEAATRTLMLAAEDRRLRVSENPLGRLRFWRRTNWSTSLKIALRGGRRRTERN